MNKTRIEWCDSTWNPVTGCLHDCEYCYARRIANRFGEHREEAGVVELHFKRDNPYPFDFYPTFHKYRLDEPAKKTKGQNIFVCSMADLFGNWVPDEWIKEIFEACEKAPQHNYLFLTKNPIRYEILHQDNKLIKSNNMWYGFSIINNSTFQCWIDSQHNTFISVEPILEDLNQQMIKFITSVNWIIIGAETGNRKDKVIPKKEWIDNIVEHCKKSGIPVFMKDSLISIMGKENMLREFPKELKGEN